MVPASSDQFNLLVAHSALHYSGTETHGIVAKYSSVYFEDITTQHLLALNPFLRSLSLDVTVIVTQKQDSTLIPLH